MFSPAFFGRSIRGRRVHHRGVLVHSLDIVCQPGGDGCARALRYIRRHSTDRCSRLRRGTVRRRNGGDSPVSMARASVAGDGTGRRDATVGTHPAMKTVLFACVHNAGRSQMAAAWFNALADPLQARAISAGTDPGPRVHPEVLAVMREVGVDLAAASTTKLTPEVAQRAQLLVTMGCGDECPYVPGAERDDWPLEDPKGKPIERVREIRDEIRGRVRVLIEREGWSPTR